MVFTPIDNDQIKVGDPVVKELWDTTKENFDDLDSRLTAQETISGKILVSNELWHGLHQLSGGIVSHLASFEAPQNMTIVKASIRQYVAGLSGSTEIDVRVGASEGAASSIFSVKPILVPGDGNNGQDGGTINSGSVSEGQLIILDFTQIQVNTGKIQVVITGEPA